MYALRNPYSDYALGAAVGMRIGPLPLPQHMGILAPHPIWGRSVISFGPDGIVEEPAQQFAAGRRFDSVSYPGTLPWQSVVRRARNAIVMRSYDPIAFNCDYFVCYCHGMKLQSPQVATIAVLSVVGVIAWVSAA